MFEDFQDRGKKETVIVIVEGPGKLYQRIFLNTPKMFYVKYAVVCQIYV